MAIIKTIIYFYYYYFMWLAWEEKSFQSVIEKAFNKGFFFLGG